jgi:predicted nucleotidyltransferase
MKRDEVLTILSTHREPLQELGVRSLSLFGSVARDEARPDSDVDLLVEFDRQGGLFQLLRVQYYLEDILGCSVDLGTLNSLKEHSREPVLKDIIHAF